MSFPLTSHPAMRHWFKSHISPHVFLRKRRLYTRAYVRRVLSPKYGSRFYVFGILKLPILRKTKKCKKIKAWYERYIFCL